MAALVQGDPYKHWSPDLSRQKSLQAVADASVPMQQSLDFNETVLPEYDYGVKAMQLGSKAAQLNYNSAVNNATNTANEAIQNALSQQNAQTSSLDANGKPRLQALLRALRQQESGGNFGAVNSSSGALGAYQVMPSNLGGQKSGWDYEALGRDVSPKEFLNSKKLQNQVARYKFGQYLNKHGAKGALSAWYSGSPTRWNERTPQGNYPSVRDYVLQVLDRLK